jgi:hypothetical protein
MKRFKLKINCHTVGLRTNLPGLYSTWQNMGPNYFLYNYLYSVCAHCISTLDFLSIIIYMQFSTKVYDLNNLSIFLIVFLK